MAVLITQKITETIDLLRCGKIAEARQELENLIDYHPDTDPDDRYVAWQKRTNTDKTKEKSPDLVA